METSILRLPEVVRRTGLSKSGVYLAVRTGRLPRPVKISGSRASGWVAGELEAHLNKAMEARKSS